MSLSNEDITRIRVREVIENGMRAQQIQRDLGHKRKPSLKTVLLMFFLAIILGSCSQIATGGPIISPPVPSGSSPVLQSSPDWVERYSPVAASSASLSRSAWIKRHLAIAASSASVAGSDWIERHPPTAASSASLAGSDWVERHPADLTSDFLVGSD
jgi:hypothetical protein